MMQVNGALNLGRKYALDLGPSSIVEEGILESCQHFAVRFIVNMDTHSFYHGSVEHSP